MSSQTGHARAATAPTLSIALQNNTSSSAVWAYVTGLEINKNNALFLLSADGRTAYHPASPPAIGTPLAADCGIALGAPGTSRTVAIPHLAGARVWFCVGARLTFLLNPGPALVEPSATNPSGPNYDLAWSFAELTFNAAEAFANISFVDSVGLPVSLALRSAGAAVQTVGGLAPDGLAAVCAGLAAQHAADGAGWDRLVVRTPAGQILRALSPNSGIALRGPSLFAGYWQPYVDRVWAKYASASLEVDTQAAWGVVTGRVDAASGMLTFTPPAAGGPLAVAKPSAADIFSCSTGAFATTSGELGAINARLAAALNRSTLLAHARQPSGHDAAVVATYYAGDPVTNHYARLVHAASAGGLGYAFPYDDVGPSAAGANVAGTVSDANPDLLVVAVGGPATMPGAGTAERIKPTTRGGGGRTGLRTIRQWVLGKLRLRYP